MVLATHLLSGCMVSGASEEGQFVEWVVGCARKVRGQRQRDRRLQGRVARRVEGHVVDVPVFEVMKRDQQERVQETIAEQIVTAAEPVDGCEYPPQGVEVPVSVSRERIQRLAFEQLAGFSEAVEESVIKVVPQDSIQQRTFEQFSDFPEVLKESFLCFLSRDEFQQREKCIEMLEQLMNVPKTVLQDRVQRWCAEQSAEFPASQDMKEPVCTARRRGAGGDRVRGSPVGLVMAGV